VKHAGDEDDEDATDPDSETSIEASVVGEGDRLPSPASGRPASEVPAAALTGDELVRFGPDWCLFWGKGVRSSQLDIWLPYVRQSRYRYAVLTARGDIAPADRAKIAALPNVVIGEPYEQALEALRRCKGLRGFLYISTLPENFALINQQQRKAHVFIGHGESGKGGSGVRTGSIYDSIFVADYATVRRFPRAIRRWVGSGACAIGAPIFEGTRKDPWTRPRTVRTILYAPTWESGRPRGDYTSLEVVAPLLIDLMPALAVRGIRVIVRPHPWTGTRLPESKALLDGLRAAGALMEVSKTEAFERADVLIGDISGVTAEFLLTQKPAIMPITSKLTDHDRDAAWLDIEYPWVYRWDATGDGLLNLLTMIETDDAMRKRRASEAKKKFRHHRSLDDAVRTFDIALSVTGWRRTPIPVRIPFEAKLLVARLRGRRGLMQRRRQH